ncbi:MAG TPA: hypothetical protein VN722_12095 [Hanamia sp.]|nr:hypothetical protein [Hanamia sp.]
MPTKKRVLAKTWEEFCKLTKRIPEEFPADAISKRSIADFKLSTMILYYNGGKLPDFTDGQVWKYEPWWRIVKDDKHPSGFGLSYRVYDNWRTFTAVGPRFAFLDSDVLEHMVKYFINDYIDLIL